MTRHLLAVTTCSLLLLTACGADTGTASDGDAPATSAAGACEPGTANCRDDLVTLEPEAPGSGGVAAGACLEGAPDCADVPTGTGGPESGPDGSLPVQDALAAGVDGPFLMSGYYVADGSGARLCEALAESFPPQCGGASVPLDESGTPVDATTTTDGDVTWSDEPVPVEGEIVGGVFVVGAP